MTKYTRIRHKEVERRWAIHPIWRGIGCLMALLFIIMGYVVAKQFLDYNEKAKVLEFPKVIYQPVYIKYTQLVPAFKNNDVINKFLKPVKYGYLAFTLVFVLIGFGVFSLIYSAIYRISGPSRYGPHDSPEMRRTIRRM